MTTPGQDKLIEQLLDGGVELESLGLEQLPVEDLIQAIAALRGRVLVTTSLLEQMSEQIKLIDAFSRPKTKRYFYVASGSRRIQ